MKTTASLLSTAAAAWLLAGPSATAGTLGLRTDADFFGFTPAQLNRGSALWDTFPSFTFANDAPDSSDIVNGLIGPTFAQSGALTVMGQGGGLYDKFTDAPTPDGQPGDMIFSGGNNLSYTVSGSLSFDMRGLVLQAKRPGSVASLAASGGFVPMLTIDGGAPIMADNNSFIQGTGDPNINDPGNYTVTSWFWNLSLANLPSDGSDTFTITFGTVAPFQRGVDFIAINVADTASAVPEPGSTAMTICGGLALSLIRRRRRLCA